MKIATELCFHEIDALIEHWGHLAVENGTGRHTGPYERTEIIAKRLSELGAMKERIEERWAQERNAITKAQVPA